MWSWIRGDAPSLPALQLIPLQRQYECSFSLKNHLDNILGNHLSWNVFYSWPSEAPCYKSIPKLGTWSSAPWNNPFLTLIDHFSLYVLFSHFRPRDATLKNSFFQVSSYARANARITCEKTKGTFPWEHHVVWNGKTKRTSWKGLFFLPCNISRILF